MPHGVAALPLGPAPQTAGPRGSGPTLLRATPTSRRATPRWSRISRPQRRASSARVRHYQRLGHAPAIYLLC
ncbi:hypothetical protein NDU88_007905 [Pleurodeles waltl]|uniref:Uncharacterized protein n=1 Tax=Pleurodeles waltl TaxID=8319 RepID=A0AAV7PMM4_PLEWA|nr:hypothetical protein NDU88_007905 [Pleurodeles waltl]